VPGYATRIALRELGRRVQFLDAQLGRLDELIVPLVTARPPGLLSLHGVGPDTSSPHSSPPPCQAKLTRAPLTAAAAAPVRPRGLR
jgi:hypothetical protein